MARPTGYKNEYNDLAFKFCLLGATDKQMARFFNVSEQTLNSWKKKFPKFLESLKNGKEKADAEVAQALFHRAKGYRHPEVHVSNYKGEITLTPIIKQYAPDTAACMIWLKNRAGWKDSRDNDGGIGENAEEYFKAIADAVALADTNPRKVLP